MISVASTMSRPQRTARSRGLLVLEPPRHSQLPLAFLPPGKHLIGTSDACAIRIVAEGVQPRHAMLLIGDQMILLKALDPRTWVNDGIVSETTLRPGDRISIGPITYQLRVATADELLEYNASEIEAQAQRIQIEPVRTELPPPFSPQIPPPIPPELLAEAMRFVAVPPNSESSIPTPVLQQVADVVPSVDFRDARGIAKSIMTSPTVPLGSVEVERATVSESATPISRVESEPPVAAHTLALRKIHRQIAMLNDLPTVVDHGRDDARLEEERQRLKTKEAELAQLAEELSRQAQRLRDRHAQLSEREAAHERKQSQLTQEQERLVTAAQTTRRDLAEEHGRQKTLWQEWDAAYRRTADELREQLEFVEQRRGTFQQEAERIAESRVELQRMREDFERDRRVAATERVQAAQELGELHAQRAAFETERRQHLVEMQERETQLTNERHAMAVLQDELLSSQQRMERDRTAFATERSADSLRREQEVREHTQARMRLNDEETSLHSIRIELESDRQSFEQEREILRRERERFDDTRSEIDGLRTELSQAKCELDLHRQSLDEHLRAKLTADEDLGRLQAEIESVRRSKTDLESKLEAERRELQRERNAFDFERTDVNVLRAELSSVQCELVQKEQSFREQIQAKDAVEAEVRRLQGEVDDLRQSGIHLQTQLDADRNQFQRERESFMVTREDLSTALAAAQAAEIRVIEPLRIDHSTTVPQTHDHWSYESATPAMHEGLSVRSHESSSDSLAGSMPMLPPPIPVDGQWSTGSAAWSGQSFGDMLVGEGAAVQQSAPLHSDEIANWQDDRAWTSGFEANPVLQTDVPLEVQTSLMDELCAIPDELRAPLQQNDAVAHRVLETLDSTLSDVTQLFGTNAPTHDASPRDVERFERESFEPFDGTRFDSVEPLPGIESAFRRGNDGSEGVSLPSLRAQLAQMFDLPESSPPSYTDRAPSPVDPHRSEAVVVQSDSVTEGLSQSATVSEVGHAPQETLTAAVEPAPETTLDSVETAAATTDDSEEDNAWTRRLRELSQLVAPDPSTAPAPTPPTVVEHAELSVSVAEPDASDVDEYSVEAQLARLLGRPRRSPNTVTNETSSASPLEEPKPFAVYVPPVEPVSQLDVDDRSHLMAEPRHRQNKNAIREEVQSFREVAQMSARTALAKHTWDNLRNEVYMTLGLTSVSAVATVWYVGSFALGSEADWWKGLACGLATLLASQRLIRASKQLNQWRRKNQLRTSTKKAPAPPLSLVVEAAVSDGGLSDNSKGVSSDK